MSYQPSFLAVVQRNLWRCVPPQGIISDRYLIATHKEVVI